MKNVNDLFVIPKELLKLSAAEIKDRISNLNDFRGRELSSLVPCSEMEIQRLNAKIILLEVVGDLHNQGTPERG
jgi:hypothetical protein